MVPDFPRELQELEEWFATYGADRLPGLLGLLVVDLGHGRCTMRMEVERKHLASNGYLHAAAVVALADTAAGYGCVASLPPSANGFTTIELKSNHLASVTNGELVAKATMVHGGRTTQVWDAVVTASSKQVALFRNTQLLLYPRT